MGRIPKIFPLPLRIIIKILFFFINYLDIPVIQNTVYPWNVYDRKVAEIKEENKTLWRKWTLPPSYIYFLEELFIAKNISFQENQILYVLKRTKKNKYYMAFRFFKKIFWERRCIWVYTIYAYTMPLIFYFLIITFDN